MLMLSMVAGRRSRLGGLAVLVTALGLSGGPMAPGTAAATPARATTTVQAFMTLYGYVDNSPPGRSIAHPCIHRRAGGAGTFTNPVTFATDVKEVGWCQIIYVPYMKRYFIHEDECSECDHDWRTLHKYRFDMWAGGDAASLKNPEKTALLRCEDTWTRWQRHRRPRQSDHHPGPPAEPSRDVGADLHCAHVVLERNLAGVSWLFG